MKHIPLKQVHYEGITILIPEIWEAATERFTEEDGGNTYSISINAKGKDIRSIDISIGRIPEGSDAYIEACGTYEEVVNEEDLDTNEEPIMCFEFQKYKAYGFNVWTDDGLPCFFFCMDVNAKNGSNLVTVLLSARNNEELESLMDFVEEYLTIE
jgi:hypothetical protein